jgi:hypothetical protein
MTVVGGAIVVVAVAMQWQVLGCSRCLALPSGRPPPCPVVAGHRFHHCPLLCCGFPPPLCFVIVVPAPSPVVPIPIAPCFHPTSRGSQQ